MPNIENIKSAWASATGVKLFDLLSEDEVRESFEEILIFTPDDFKIDGLLNDDTLCDYESLDPDEDSLTDAMRIEHGLSLFEDIDRLYQSIETYSQTVFYKCVTIGAEKYYIAYNAIAFNEGMGQDLRIENDDFIGVFRAVDDIETHLDDLGHLGLYTEPQKLEAAYSEYILENWQRD